MSTQGTVVVLTIDGRFLCLYPWQVHPPGTCWSCVRIPDHQSTDRRASMSEDEMRRAALAGHGALDDIEPFLDTLSGLVAATERRGFTKDQSHAIVAYMFGYRPANGPKPDGAAE